VTGVQTCALPILIHQNRKKEIEVVGKLDYWSCRVAHSM
jgi:hypothetical protein